MLLDYFQSESLLSTRLLSPSTLRTVSHISERTSHRENNSCSEVQEERRSFRLGLASLLKKCETFSQLTILKMYDFSYCWQATRLHTSHLPESHGGGPVTPSTGLILSSDFCHSTMFALPGVTLLDLCVAGTSFSRDLHHFLREASFSSHSIYK